MPARRIRIVGLFVISAVLLAACNLPIRVEIGGAEPTPTTERALPTEAPPSAASDTPQPSPTETETPSPTASPTEALRLARLRENTNCRTGPATVFDHMFTALKGMELAIVGRTTLSDYVIVSIPDRPGETCWLWTRYADVVGDLSLLPLSTPPPTPTPAAAFTLNYSYLEGCVGWDPGFQVVNTGSLAFRSAHITAKDTVTSTTVQQAIDVFDKRNGCAIDISIPVLNPGVTGYVYANTFVYNPTGNQLQVTVKLCTGPGLTGTCVSRSVNATP